MIQVIHEAFHVLGICPETFGILTLNDYINSIKYSIQEIKVIWLKSL